eukprot:2300468-Prymnesium_polylepis.2
MPRHQAAGKVPEEAGKGQVRQQEARAQEVQPHVRHLHRRLISAAAGRPDPYGAWPRDGALCAKAGGGQEGEGVCALWTVVWGGVHLPDGLTRALSGRRPERQQDDSHASGESSCGRSGQLGVQSSHRHVPRASHGAAGRA